uniref:Coilin N-terminal domain-containing protein n=1 Tax=Mola mola TaxID=94237 RepID=A0A3Q3VZQ8_MOLML
MATHSDTFIRVRLHFDYPPPALVGCRMCWLLVDLNTCRVVADLESIIREKFDFSRRSILNLFVEDYYLPHTESIYVLRDNDSVRWATLAGSQRHVFVFLLLFCNPPVVSKKHNSDSHCSLRKKKKKIGKQY